MLFMAAVGVWGIVAYLRGQSISGSYAGALAIGEALVLVQVGAGVAMFATGARPPTSTHYLYGLTAVLAASVRVVVPSNTGPAAGASDLQSRCPVHFRTRGAWHDYWPLTSPRPGRHLEASQRPRPSAFQNVSHVADHPS